MTIVNAKNALGLVTVAQGFEPAPAATNQLLADALAHALYQAGKTPEDMIPHLRASFATITAAHEQGRPALQHSIDTSAAAFMAGDCTSSGDPC